MRLIDADALEEEMYKKSSYDERQKWDSGLWIRYKIFEESLTDAPTVDAVPVIRCKDCRHAYYCYRELEWHSLDGGRIYNPLGMEGFCSLAERKE